MPWKPGQSGNPLGLGKGQTVYFKPILNRLLEQDVSPEDKRTKAEALASALVDRAVQGEEWAVKEVIDRMDGKAKQTVDMAAEVAFVQFGVPAPPVTKDGGGDGSGGNPTT